MSATRILLLGGGHAHLEILRDARSFVDRGIDLTLVDEGSFWYSGLATGMLGGFYTPEQDQIDIQALIERGGGRFVRGRVEAIDARRKEVRLSGGAIIRYDLLSLNLGSQAVSESTSGSIPGTNEAWSIKPLRRLWELRLELERRFREERSVCVRVSIVGGGASGCEAAANVVALARRAGGKVQVTLVAPGLLDQTNRRAVSLAGRQLARLGVVVHIGRARRIERDGVVLEDGRIDADLVIVALGLRPSSIVRSIELPIDGEGALIVDRHLRSIADPAVFGGGDCIALVDHHLPRVGVFGVRQAPILRANLHATALGGGLRVYKPQRRWLQILNLGDGTGLAIRGRFAWHGRSAWLLKDWLDRRFLRRYRL